MARRRRSTAEAALRLVALLASLLAANPAAAAPPERWNSEIAEASARFGIPAQWIRRVIQAESDGRTIWRGRPIVSSAGAMGLMQVMPGTWRDMRILHGLGPDPHDPHDNILAGTAYLRAMFDRFGYPGLFAAYNAGPARYAEHLTAKRALPAETVAYVAEIAGVGLARTAAPSRKPAIKLFVALASGRPPDGRLAHPAATALFVTLGTTAAASE